MDLEGNLARLGITGNLYRVYSAAIELGEVPVSKIIERTGLKKATVYDAINRLEQEGLVANWRDAGTRCVVANDPSVLLEQLEGRRQMLTEMLPQLRAMYNRAKGKPHIRFYEGEEGVRSALMDSLECSSGVMYAMFSMAEIMEVPGLAFMDEYQALRIQKGIEMKVIRSRSRDRQPIWHSSTREMRELRFAPEHVTLSMTTFVYDNRVTLISSKKECYGLVIESEEYAALSKAMYQAMWSISETVPRVESTHASKSFATAPESAGKMPINRRRGASKA